MVVELVRLATIPIWIWAAYSDVQTRRVPVEVWGPFVILGGVLVAIETVHHPRSLLPTAVAILICTLLALVLYRTTGIGGADVKAIISLAVLFPASALPVLAIAALASLPVLYVNEHEDGMPFLLPLVIALVAVQLYPMV